MKRVPEPDLMEQKEQAYAYANADFSNSNELFLEKLFEFYSITDETKILDVGCGDGEIPIEIYKRTKSKITVLDGSSAMLDELSKKMSANNIDDIKIKKTPGHKNIIKLDDKYSMKLKYPSMQQFIDANFDTDEEGSQVAQSINMLSTSSTIAK